MLMPHEKPAEDLIRNRQQLMAFAYALMRDHASAEEVFQEASLAVLDASAKGTTVRDFMPWAREIIRRRALEHFRSKSRRRQIVPLTETMAEVVASAFAEETAPPETEVWRLKFLRECLATISEKFQRLLELRYAREISIESLATQEGIPPENLKMALWRTRKSLAKCIRRKSALSVEG
jgi:RNA polymerase sigma-70 factor (ECF subfamily)